MIDEILRNNLIIREWLNGGLLPLNLSLVIVIGLFLWDSWREPNSDRWQDAPGVSTACALLWIFACDAMRAGLVWAILWTSARVTLPPEQLAGITTGMVMINLGFMIAGLGALLATLRCIYLFTPPGWGHAYWLWSAAMTFAFQVITYLGRGA